VAARWRSQGVSLIDIVLVDTDVMSYVFKQDSRGIPYQSHLAGKDTVISFVTFAELHRWMMASNWGSAKRRKLEEYLSNFLVLHSDDELCLRWAQIVDRGKRSGRPIQPGDAWIAATALLHNIPLVTNNARDFAGISGLTIISETSP
jgi:tRNA(fMet)-specific endonuclease VapC